MVGPHAHRPSEPARNNLRNSIKPGNRVGPTDAGLHILLHTLWQIILSGRWLAQQSCKPGRTSCPQCAAATVAVAVSVISGAGSLSPHWASSSGTPYPAVTESWKASMARFPARRMPAKPAARFCSYIARVSQAAAFRRLPVGEWQASPFRRKMLKPFTVYNKTERSYRAGALSPEGLSSISNQCIPKAWLSPLKMRLC